MGEWGDRKWTNEQLIKNKLLLESNWWIRPLGRKLAFWVDWDITVWGNALGGCCYSLMGSLPALLRFSLLCSKMVEGHWCRQCKYNQNNAIEFMCRVSTGQAQSRSAKHEQWEVVKQVSTVFWKVPTENCFHCFLLGKTHHYVKFQIDHTFWLIKTTNQK